MKTLHRLTIFIFLIFFISGCGTTIKTVITSDPPGANIYMGETPDNMHYEGITPLTYTYKNSNPYWKEWYYQIKKDGYEDSGLIHKLQGAINADRYVHATLKPIGEKENKIEKAEAKQVSDVEQDVNKSESSVVKNGNKIEKAEEKKELKHEIEHYPKKVYTNDEYFLYSKKAYEGILFKTIDMGTMLTIIQKDGDWYKIKTKNGEIGWVYKNWVTVDKALIIKDLEDKVRPIPASNIEKNLMIYKKLLKLDPNNKKYKEKVSYYNSKAAEKKLYNEELRAGSDLELLSWHWSKNYDYVTAEGQVKNISGRKLTRVQALVTWYDKNGDMITSDTSFIEYDPILPGQISPFKVMERYNPAMKKANIEFKYMGGGEIPTYRK